MQSKSKVRKWLERLLLKPSSSSSQSSKTDNAALWISKLKSLTLAEKSPRNPRPEVNQEDLDHLKRQPEWESVVNFFYNDLRMVQGALLGDLDDEKLQRLSAKGQNVKRYLIWALEAPKNEEGRE